MAWSSEDVVRAARNRDFDTVLAALTELIERGVAVDTVRDADYVSEPPIWVQALREGRGDIARLAISAGADVNARDAIGTPALVLAAELGMRDLVDLLIDRGADVNASSESTDPLSAAAKAGRHTSHSESHHKACVESLLAHGAIVNATNEYGHTPLMCAAIGGDVGILQLLVAAGSRPDATDRQGRDVMYYATSNGNDAAAHHIAGLGTGLTRTEKLQGVLTLSRLPMSDWDASELHRDIEQSQHELGHMTDRGVFRASHVAAGDSLDDQAYVYASVRTAFAGLGDEVIERCYVHDFQATDGNSGKYVVLLDRPRETPEPDQAEQASAADQAPAPAPTAQPAPVPRQRREWFRRRG